MIKDLDSIIFDLDGTLWDATGTVAKAWQTAIGKVDFVEEPLTQSDVQKITGLPYNVIYEKLFPSLDNQQRTELKNLCTREELRQIKEFGGKLYPDLEATLRYLKEKYRLFIVSNCQSGYIEAFMEHHNLHQYFEDCECFGNADRPKSENIQEIIRRNNLQSAVYVGDTQGDLDASLKSGVPFIYARYGFGKLEPQTFTIDKISDLKDLL